MKISRDNYEQYFIDYIEGNLTKQDLVLLEQFLLQNPDLAEELNGINAVRLNPIDENAPSWLNLKKKEIDADVVIPRLDYLCIAKFEGDLTTSEANELYDTISTDTSIEKVSADYSHLKLKPDYKIIFSQKSSLHRVRIIGITRKSLINMVSVAASLGLFFGIYTLSKDIEIPNNDIVEQKSQNIIEQPTIEENPVVHSQIFVEHQPAVIVKSKLKEKSFNEYNNNDINNINVEYERENVLPINPNPLKSFEISGQMAQTLPFGSKARDENYTELTNSETLVLTQALGQSRVLDIYDLAQYGVKRLSYLTESNIALDLNRDSEGKIKKINLETGLFAVSVPLKKR